MATIAPSSDISASNLPNSGNGLDQGFKIQPRRRSSLQLPEPILNSVPTVLKPPQAQAINRIDEEVIPAAMVNVAKARRKSSIGIIPPLEVRAIKTIDPRLLHRKKSKIAQFALQPQHFKLALARYTTINTIDTLDRKVL